MKKRLHKIAIVHDWLTGMRGGEKVLDAFCELFPNANLFTLIHIKGSVSPRIENMKIRTSFLQQVPNIEKHYRQTLLLMPWAIRQFDLSGYDFVLSSSHCVAKAVRTTPGTPHVCYCHTPMRYIWDQFDDYFGHGRSSWPIRFMMSVARPRLQSWDQKTSQTVSHFIANSQNVRRRILKHYGQESAVIYPPIDVSFFQPNGRSRGDFFLMVSAFAPYKKIEVAIEAFKKLRWPLVIAGHGQEFGKFSRQTDPHVKFLGWVSDETLRSLYQGARAVIFPGEEDFGMVPLEAQSCGCPVIALSKGGALESVIPGHTGIFFDEPTSQDLSACLLRFKPQDFDPIKIRQHSLQFSRKAFLDKVAQHLQDCLPNTDFGFATSR